jgi:hypothetical protein
MRQAFLMKTIGARGTAMRASVALRRLERAGPEGSATDASRSISIDDVRSSLRVAADGARLAGSASILVPSAFWGIGVGYHVPDHDITMLGIGHHRYFLYHSAASALILRKLFVAYQRRMGRTEGVEPTLSDKVAGGLLGSLAVGVGIHLGIDVVQPKAVIFPFFGSLISGTLVDDNVWLLANSLWAFRCAADIFVLSFGDDLERVNSLRRRWYGPLEAGSVTT